MGYRINYKHTDRQSFLKYRQLLLIVIALLCFIKLISSRWAGGAAVFGKLIPFDNPSVAVSALDSFTFELWHGNNLPACVTEFINILIYDYQ